MIIMRVRVYLNRLKGIKKDCQLSGFWEGRAAKTFQTCYAAMLTEGSYQEVLEQVTGMRTIMEDALPSLKALKWKCDHFDACLSGGLSTTSFLEQQQSTMFLEDVSDIGKAEIN